LRIGISNGRQQGAYRMQGELPKTHVVFWALADPDRAGYFG
jgi:hypothetical protein